LDQGTLTREETLELADDLDARAAKAEEMRAGFASAVWISEGMLRDGQYRQDEKIVADSTVNLRNARLFVAQTAKERDACLRAAQDLRESLGDHVDPAAMSADYRVRYAAAASRYATTATLVYLGQDTSTLVAAEAAATWAFRHPGGPTLAAAIAERSGAPRVG
jgi:hypothetical protein